MDKDDFKRARLCSPEEINEIAELAWSQISSKPKTISVQSNIVKESNTVRIDNCEKHLEFCSANLPDFKSDSSSESSEDKDCEDAKLPLPENERLKPSEFYEKYVARTKEECEIELKAPQRSALWLEARKFCITASQFGAAIGESQYQTPDNLVKEKLWNSFVGNSATMWGNEHENHAKEAFCEWFSNTYAKQNEITEFEFIEENLVKFSEEPWMAVSPDGIIKYKKGNEIHYELVEFKCPAYYRNTAGHPYSKYSFNIPPYYKSQIQGIMGYFSRHHPLWKTSKCWFVVWQPHQTWITPHNFDPQYYETLHEKLQAWYFEKYLPALAHKFNGLLSIGDSRPSEPITV